MNIIPVDDTREIPTPAIGFQAKTPEQAEREYTERYGDIPAKVYLYSNVFYYFQPPAAVLESKANRWIPVGEGKKKP